MLTKTASSERLEAQGRARDALATPFDYSAPWLASKRFAVLPQPEYFLNLISFTESVANSLRLHDVKNLVGVSLDPSVEEDEAVFEFLATGEDIFAYRDLTWVHNTLVMNRKRPEAFALLCTPEYSLYAASEDVLRSIFTDPEAARDAYLDYEDWTVPEIARSIQGFESYFDWI